MLIRAAWVIPITSPPIRDGVVRIDRDNRILDVEPWRESLRHELDIVELSDCVLMPGLVNPHTHLELTGYHGQLRPAPLWDWISELIKLRLAPGQIEREREYVADGARRLLRAGVTLVGDISRRNIAFDVLKKEPLRSVNFVEILAIAQDPPRNLTELQTELARHSNEQTWNTKLGVSPHAPYSVPAEMIAGALEIAREQHLPWTMHWAETREEVAFLASGVAQMPKLLRQLMDGVVSPPHLRPIEFLAACTAVQNGDRAYKTRGSIAHGNYVTDAEFAALATLDVPVIYCPRAHHFFGHSPHPWLRMLSAGVPLAIGTDSMASNEGLSPLEELRFLRRNITDCPDPLTLLRLVTRNAANALGTPNLYSEGASEQWVGALSRGMFADFAAFPISPDSTDPAGDLIDAAPPARAVWVAGTRVL